MRAIGYVEGERGYLDEWARNWRIRRHRKRAICTRKNKVQTATRQQECIGRGDDIGSVRKERCQKRKVLKASISGASRSQGPGFTM